MLPVDLECLAPMLDLILASYRKVVPGYGNFEISKRNSKGQESRAEVPVAFSFDKMASYLKRNI